MAKNEVDIPDEIQDQQTLEESLEYQDTEIICEDDDLVPEKKFNDRDIDELQEDMSLREEEVKQVTKHSGHKLSSEMFQQYEKEFKELNAAAAVDGEKEKTDRYKMLHHIACNNAIPYRLVDKEKSGTGIIFEPSMLDGKYRRCTLCKLAINDTDTYNWVATLLLEGVSFFKTCISLEEHYRKNRPDRKIIDRRSFYTHYRDHISPTDYIRLKNAGSVGAMAGDNSELIKSISTDLIKYKAIKNAIDSGDFDEYKEICCLYAKFRDVHDRIYKRTASLTTTKSDGSVEWSQTKIQTYVQMVNTQKAILAEVGKMRQGDKLVTIVAKFIIELYTKSIVSKLTEEFNTLSTIMRRHGVTEDIMSAFESVTSGRLARLLVDEAQNAMEVTQKEFKLTSVN